VELIFYQFTAKPAVLCPKSSASMVVHEARMVCLAAGSSSSFLHFLSRVAPSCDSRGCWGSSAWRRGGEVQTLCPAILWCTRGKRILFAKTVILVYLLRKVFHHEGGQSLEEGLGGSPPFDTLRF